MILFKNSKNPIHIMSEKQRVAEIEKFQDQREANICRHIGLYLKGEQHAPFSKQVEHLLETFHIKEAVDSYNKANNNA